MNVSLQIDKLTVYNDVNEFIKAYLSRLLDACKEKIIGIYLTGSLSYGDFNLKSSDIDITNILSSGLNDEQLKRIGEMHQVMETDFPKWSRRFECTYTTIAMLSEKLPPKEPRPWYDGNESRLYREAHYGYEWLINKYLLYKYSIALAGPDFKNITNCVEMKELQQACIKNVLEEWKPKINDEPYFTNDHYAVYFVLNLCRILYTLFIAKTGTKRQSSEWAKIEFPQWDNVILSAQRWEHGKVFPHKKEITAFAQFAFKKIEETESYKTYITT